MNYNLNGDISNLLSLKKWNKIRTTSERMWVCTQWRMMRREMSQKNLIIITKRLGRRQLELLSIEYSCKTHKSWAVNHEQGSRVFSHISMTLSPSNVQSFSSSVGLQINYFSKQIKYCALHVVWLVNHFHTAAIKIAFYYRQ